MARKQESKRVTATLDQDLYAKLSYAAERRGQSMSDCLRDAVQLLIRYENEDYYPLAKLEATRINQLFDGFCQLSTDVRNLIDVVHSTAGTLLGMTNGDNYLLRAGQDAGTDLAPGNERTEP